MRSFRSHPLPSGGERQLFSPPSGDVATCPPSGEVFVAIRCQAVESVSYLVHRLATVATCPPSGEVFVAIRCQAVENVSYLVHRLATVATWALSIYAFHI